jgi:hypothetical protein
VREGAVTLSRRLTRLEQWHAGDGRCGDCRGRVGIVLVDAASPTGEAADPCRCGWKPFIIEVVRPEPTEERA